MSVSTDATLFYGYCSDDEGWPEEWGRNPALPPGKDPDEDDDSDWEWEEQYASRKGVEGLFDEFDSDRFDIDKAYAKSWRDRWAKKDALVNASGVTIGMHCSGECPMYYIAVAASELTASRGYPQEVNDARLICDANIGKWNRQLDEFCETMGIPLRSNQKNGPRRSNQKNGPRWWLVSYWG